jgi:heptosyltransferase-2
MAGLGSPVHRLVIRSPNWLGDAVLALPAMAAVRRHFPDAHLTVAAVPSVAALFREETGVRPDRVMELPDTTRAAVAALEGGAFDAGLLFPNSFRSAWQMARAGIGERWGFATAGRGLLLTRRSPRAPRSDARHQVDYYRALVRGLQIACDDGPPVLRASEASLERARALVRQRGVPSAARLVAVAPGAAYGSAKQWPPDRVAAVLARLVRQADVTAVLVGASHDRQAAREIESWFRAHAPDAAGRVVDLVGRTSLGALVGLTSWCEVFVSNDSGAMHVAAALGRPVVAIFGPTDERVTGPIGAHDVITAQVFCRPCQLRDCPIDHRCMKRITVDQVFAAALRHLRPDAGSEDPALHFRP